MDFVSRDILAIFMLGLTINPFPNDKFWTLPKSKSLQTIISNLMKVAEHSPTWFAKQVENTVGKGEIARYEQFLLFPQCFQKNCIGNT